MARNTCCASRKPQARTKGLELSFRIARRPHAVHGHCVCSGVSPRGQEGRLVRRCLECNYVYAGNELRCGSCGAMPASLGKVPLYAPALAKEGGGFDVHHFAELARLESKNFWFRARNRLILWSLQNYYPDFKSFLEIGCGTGFVLAGLAQAFPQAQLHGSEVFSEGLHFAMARLPNVDFMQMDARAIPFVGEFDVLGAFDVLEHIQEDVQVLKQMHAALKPGGLMILTVPQHAWLWSPLDDSAFHVRRYASKELHEKVQSAGFSVLRSTSFVSFLLPLMLLSRWIARRWTSKKSNGLPELQINPLVNKLFELLMFLEITCIQVGVSFPLGGSRLLIAKKSALPADPQASLQRT